MQKNLEKSGGVYLQLKSNILQNMAKEKNKSEKDYSGESAVGAGAAGAVGSSVALGVLTGGSASASAITYALAAVGSVAGGGMAAGLGILIGGPVALAGAGYGIAKGVKKIKNKKK